MRAAQRSRRRAHEHVFTRRSSHVADFDVLVVAAEAIVHGVFFLQVFRVDRSPGNADQYFHAGLKDHEVVTFEAARGFDFAADSAVLRDAARELAKRVE